MTTEAQTAEIAAGRLRDLPGGLEHTQAGFAAVVASLRAGEGATLDGVWGSSCALVAAALAAAMPAAMPTAKVSAASSPTRTAPLVVVLPRTTDVDDFNDDLSLFTTLRVEVFPAWETALSPDRPIQDEAHGDRLRVLKHLWAQPPRIVVTTIAALMQGVPDRAAIAAHTKTLQLGDVLDLKQFAAWLTEQGFHATSAVELPGEFSLRGGIMDIFAPDWNDPVRVELFGDQIESLRRFEVASQRSLATVDAVAVTVVEREVETKAHFASYLPPQSWFLLLEPAEINDQAKHFLERSEKPQELHRPEAVLEQIVRFPSATAAAVSSDSYETTCRLSIESVERFSGEIGRVKDELDTVGDGYEVIVVCANEAEMQRLREVLAGTQLFAQEKLHFVVGHLQNGFRLIPERLILVSGGELFHRTDLSRPSRRRLGRVIDSFLDLREGDYVVHLSHGIGRYRGLKLITKNDRVEEHLELEFDGGTKIFVPAANIDLVQKYVGGSKSRPQLAKIGGKLWVRQKEAAKQAVTDLASDMLQLQATRAMRPGIAFPADTAWQREFDASFPYQETADQLSAIAALKKDMEQPRPMDRLLCGDVGYGKTEMAIRAAFKAIDCGYQVAVLVPTTILAEQHRRTFSSRMAEFPFSIAALSRFCTAKEQKTILEGIAAGTIDIVIGTHRLAQHDIQFQNLGLLIIDEEQRFGVEVKERLKALRASVDVLTMTATPIPRTLHMSLLGLRDISSLETPPQERLAVETRVTRFHPDLIRHAVMRELNRGGQVFFVHNRIHDIELVKNKLQRIVPEARIEIGHGQMGEGALEDVMLGFVQHQFDVLLATTIIESGLDIPNANTIFIDDADQYGLADLHQLRGRVGRYKHRAYCYLLVDPAKHLSTTSAKRLRAIEEFSDMGAGFAIAMRDLEIRGAGNILGTQQSGHIAAVGYELYCELLEQAVRRMKHLPPRKALEVHIDLPGEAYVPPTYVPDLRAKIDLYRRLSRVTTDEELSDLAREMVDRFGRPPRVVDRLLKRAELRVAAARWGIEAVHREDNYLVFAYTNRQKIEELARRERGRLRIADDRSAYLVSAGALTDGDEILAAVEAVLRAS
ncbi:MAG TPA: transcription-repair coupling factor [Pirellulales bacterium]|jgi:transcription-repair coupling factor (superfamily II helicase)|nr:transcription-repair coupling factor [Pirellulales bacterium]